MYNMTWHYAGGRQEDIEEVVENEVIPQLKLLRTS